jgi:hypothetical protein
MLNARLVVRVLAGVVLLAAAQERVLAKEDKKPEQRSGTVVGVVTAKGPAFLEVKAAGEDKARRYVPKWVGGLPKNGGGPDKKMMATIKAIKVGSRVRLNWVFEERPRVVKVEVLKAPEGKEEGGKGQKAPVRKGTIVGTLTGREKTWVEIKADGEEKPRRYFLYQGGTRELLATMRNTPVGSRVKIEWMFHERPRVLKLEVTKAAEKK